MAGKRRTFPAVLDFTRKDLEELISTRTETGVRLSISGVQDKVLLSYYRGKLTFQPVKDQPSEYILKLIPARHLEFRMDVPANEHLSMHACSYVFGMVVAPCCMVELADGEPALAVKRFDFDTQGGKISQEDFCQIAGRSDKSHGKNYKYDFTCQELMELIDTYSSAPILDKMTLFEHLVVNYAIGNGDAHAKNFSMQTVQREVMLTPGYDILSTALHIPNEARTALELFPENRKPTKAYEQHAFYTGSCFMQFAEDNRLIMDRAEALIKKPKALEGGMEKYIQQSFLSDPAKNQYLNTYRDRLKALSY